MSASTQPSENHGPGVACRIAEPAKNGFEDVCRLADLTLVQQLLATSAFIDIPRVLKRLHGCALVVSMAFHSRRQAKASRHVCETALLWSTVRIGPFFQALRTVLLVIGLLLAPAIRTDAHPVPFSYLDVRLGGTAIDVTLVTHIFDLAHDLNVTPAEQLLDANVVRQRAGEMSAMLGPRLQVEADGRTLPATWSAAEPLPDRQSVRFEIRYPTGSPSGTVRVTTAMFPYDPNHQTFVNVYEGEALTQAILDRGRPSFEYFAGTRQGIAAVVRRFIPSGIHHILIGPDHLLFLVGLLLLGGTIRQLLIVVTSFTLAHSITLSLAALNIVTPPARVIEPAIALSIVYVGADNLLARGGRDVRAWIAFAFGFIHGFGFANVLREMDLPRRALGWSLFSFNFGVEIGQLLVVVAVASALASLRSRSETAGRRVALAGSVVVIAAGAFWFIQRVFFPA
jgi:hydrogenase/urease accessory protein HupE